jgi:hypothetical protein
MKPNEAVDFCFVFFRVEKITKIPKWFENYPHLKNINVGDKILRMNHDSVISKEGDISLSQSYSKPIGEYMTKKEFLNDTTI